MSNKLIIGSDLLLGLLKACYVSVHYKRVNNLEHLL